jgi:protein gp37
VNENEGVKRQMNKTRIEWTDYTWNPITGCWGPGGTAEKPNRCAYCYAWKINARFAGGRILSGNMAGHEHLDPFAPTFHTERLSQPSKVKKPSRIFVGSMTDLFGDWVPDEWIEAVINRVQRADYSHHTYQFLTKNPKRLQEFNPWPANCWVGTTVTNQADADERLPWLLQVDASVRFVSHEPLLGQMDVRHYLCAESNPCSGGCESAICESLQWAIIGAMTGLGAIRSDVDWVMNLAEQYQSAGIPIFLKDNLGFKDQPQEFPS